MDLHDWLYWAHNPIWDEMLNKICICETYQLIRRRSNLNHSDEIIIHTHKVCLNCTFQATNVLTIVGVASRCTKKNLGLKSLVINLFFHSFFEPCNQFRINCNILILIASPLPNYFHSWLHWSVRFPLLPVL